MLQQNKSTLGAFQLYMQNVCPLSHAVTDRRGHCGSAHQAHAPGVHACVHLFSLLIPVCAVPCCAVLAVVHAEWTQAIGKVPKVSGALCRGCGRVVCQAALL